ncbi:MAG: sigma-70 family RNA polymerase sigma factor [Gammaproteobacteria bacterium]|nr:sigma-70 family RNA polymerase sigma factor [Gammaproteobacteria bacterium]
MQDELNELLARCALGDQRALARLYEQTSAKLYGLALGVLRQPELAEDVLQDAFLKIWRSAEQFRPGESSALTWMSSIVRHRAIDKIRQQQRDFLEFRDNSDVGAMPDMIDHRQHPDHAAAIRSDLQSLMMCLQDLDEPQRNAILMSYYRGYSHQELAKHLTQPLGTIKGWVRRGMERLKMCMGELSI